MIDSIPSPRSMPAARRQEVRQLLETAVASPTDVASSRWRSRSFAIGAGAALALAGGTAAAAYVTFAPATDKSAVRCYTDMTLGNGSDFHGTTVAVAGPDGTGPASIDDALAACTRVWRDGVITMGATNAQGPAREGSVYPVPPLSACVAEDGVAIVFPGEGVCARLGVPQLQK